MLVLPSTTIVLATLNHAVAQETSARDDSSALSEIVGPFTGPTLIFAPDIRPYDFISAVGSTGTNDETTTYKAYASSTMADPENRLNDIPGDQKVGKQAYATFTLGPTTFQEEGVLPYVTDSKSVEEGSPTIQTIDPGPTISPPWYSKVSKRQETDASRARTLPLEEDTTTITYSGGPMPTECSYTTEPRKAVCTITETDAMEAGTRRTWRTRTWEGERGWVSVYVLLDPNAATTTTSEQAGAEETGSMTAMTSLGSGSGSAAPASAATTTQAGAAAEVTAWVHAVVVVAAAAAMAL